MGLAVPAALTVAVGRGAQLGVLFKGGEALERLAHVDAIVLDKTGTLTVGRPVLEIQCRCRERHGRVASDEMRCCAWLRLRRSGQTIRWRMRLWTTAVVSG